MSISNLFDVLNAAFFCTVLVKMLENDYFCNLKNIKCNDIVWLTHVLFICPTGYEHIPQNDDDDKARLKD